MVEKTCLFVPETGNRSRINCDQYHFPHCLHTNTAMARHVTLSNEIQPAMQRAVGVGRLSVKQLDGRTRIDRLYQEGCARIRIPKTYHGTALEAVIINTSGGVTGGDRMAWSFEAGQNTHLMVTTQASEKIYKSSAGLAANTVTLKAEQGARLAWLPQESIVFDCAGFSRTITADLAEGAEALFLEPIVLGRRSMGERVESADLRDRWRISQGGQLIHAEDFRLNGEIASILSQQAVTAGQTAFATLLFVSPRADGFLNEARQLIGPNGGISCWNGKLLARVMAEDSFQLRKILLPLVTLMNFEADLPKVWSL